jgi:RNA polymerase sigma-70 factor (ECF subfamily)
MDDGEDELTKRSRQGDAEAFGILVRRYAVRATALAAVLVRNHADAVDLSQDAFVRAWRHIATFQGYSSFFAWYCRILRNTCSSWLRKRRPRGDAALLDDLHTSPAADPAVLAERNEQADRLWEAILRLSDGHREIIVLSHFDGLSYKEMAVALEIPLGTVMSRLHAARKQLRARLAGEEP